MSLRRKIVCILTVFSLCFAFSGACRAPEPLLPTALEQDGRLLYGLEQNGRTVLDAVHEDLRSIGSVYALALEGRWALFARDGSWRTDYAYEDALPCEGGVLCIESAEHNRAVIFSYEGQSLLDTRKMPVYESLAPLPEGRQVVELRVFQLLPKYPEFPGNVPQLGHAYAENARLYLGSVPVEADGSAHFKAPSRKPLYFQAVDETGRAVQTMRSEVYLQDGESRGCVGCHEQAGYTGRNVETQSLALGRPASELAPGPRDARPFAYPRLIQPILDRACVSCHRDATNDDKTTSDSPQTVAPDLTGAVEGEFTRSYDALKPYLRWYEWGGASIQQVATLPGRCGADESPLTAILNDENHRDLPNFTDADRRTLYLWLDANVPFYGVYDRRERQKILNGESVAPPRLQ